MTNLSAGLAQARAPGTSRPGGAGIESCPRSPLSVDRDAWIAGACDAVAGKPWRLTPGEVLERAAELGPLSYMLGYRAGELQRKRERLCAAK